MFCHRRMSAQDRRRRIHKRHVLIIAACILLTAAVVGGTYCITTILLQRTKSAHTAHIVSSPTSQKSTSNLFTASTGDPTEGGTAFEVRKINLTGYKAKFPNLYARKKVGQWKNAGNKTIYLTFDDGPSALTPKLLNVLKKHHVKATFSLPISRDRRMIYTTFGIFMKQAVLALYIVPAIIIRKFILLSMRS